MQYFSPQAQWLHFVQLLEVALLEQTNGAFYELTIVDVCHELLHCAAFPCSEAYFSMVALCSAVDTV